MLEPLDAMESLAVISLFGRGREIDRRDDHWYRIVSGAARKCVLMADGRRQVLDFLLPGDFFGFARGYEHHFFVVEVMIEGTAVARYSAAASRCSPPLTPKSQRESARLRSKLYPT